MSARPGRPPTRLPIDPGIFRLRPWYHDFSSLGLRTDFESGPLGPLRRADALLRERRASGTGLRGLLAPLARTLLGGRSPHRVNQPIKEAVILPWLQRGLEHIDRAQPRCLELFCADGYYACHLARLRPDAQILALDRDTRHIARARAASRALGLGRLHPVAEEAAAFLSRLESPFDLVLCAGGLYHLSDPRGLLAALHRKAPQILLLQSVVSLAHEERDYFEAPAPGWRHGSRFSHARLEDWLEETGWRILESTRNELPGNRRPSDRGASYFLCAGQGGRSAAAIRTPPEYPARPRGGRGPRPARSSSLRTSRPS